MKHLILTFLIFTSTIVISQDAEQVRINEIDQQIKTAVNNENYELAAKLKEEKEYRLKIKTAIDNENYEEAAVIKKELDAFLNGSSIEPTDSKGENEPPKKINVADLNLKIGAMKTEEFLYGFAKGDKVVFSFIEETGKELKEIEILQYSGSSKFKSYKTATISEKTIEVQETGIFVFRFSNGTMTKRVCNIKLSRIPASVEMAKFNTAVYWRTAYDTTYYTEQEKYLISTDTVIHNITDQTAKVHSAGNLSSGNRSSFNFNLPKNTVSWSYYVGVNQEGQKALEEATAELAEKAAPVVAKIPGYGPLAALALGSTSYITKLQSGEDIDFYIVDGNNVNLFLGGSTFRYYKKGKVINDFSKMTKPLKGSYHFCFMNDNAITGVTVVVKITAISVTENWGKRPVEKMKIESREVAYLKN